MSVIDEAVMVDYRMLLREINRLAQSDLVALWSLLEGADRDLIFRGLQEGVPEIVSMYRQMAVDISTEFYDMQGLSVSQDDIAFSGEVNAEQLEESLRWSVYAESSGVLGLAGGIVQHHVLDGARVLGATGIASSGKRWVRAAHPSACAFCRMLATRGLDGRGGYSSKDAGSFVASGRKASKRPTGAKFHDHCMCVPVLADAYTPPDYVSQWEQDYFAAVDAAGGAHNVSAVLSQMRTISGHSH